MDRFKAMETYVAVVQEQSYTRAARRLGITRAMVSKRMQDLEAVLGARLLHRDPHGVTVTGIGADYFESCVSVLAQVSAAEERAQTEIIVPRGRLKILATKTFGETVLAPLLADFCLAYPDIEIQVTLADRRLDLSDRNYDVAIGTLPETDSALTARAIVNLPRILVASPDYLARHGAPAAPQDLMRHNCLDPSGAGHNTWHFRSKNGGKANGRKDVRVSGGLRSNTSAVVRHAALKGLGIAILREYLVSDDLERGALVRVLPGYELDKHALYAIFPGDSHMPARIRVLIDYLVDSLKTLPGNAAYGLPSPPPAQRGAAARAGTREPRIRRPAR